MKTKWSNKEANLYIKNYLKKGINKELALRIYTTRLLGNGSKIVLHGGGNTSLKSTLNNVKNKSTDIIYVKGSGKDMSDIDIKDFPSLELNNLLQLKNFKKLSDFEMINFQKKYMIDTTFPNASVETLLHAFLPHKYIDHSHSNAILSLVNQPNAKSICKKIFDDKVGVVPYIMPGFDLSKKAIEIFETNPNVQGLILLNHGIFTFGDTAKESYERMIHFISVAEKELKKCSRKIKSKKYIEKKITVSKLSNILRKFVSAPKNDDFDRKIISFSKFTNINTYFSENIINMINGPVTPDHVIRTKHKPLFLDFSKLNIDNIEKLIGKKFYNYRKQYISYFNRNKHLNKSAKMHDPNPRLIIVKGLGIFSIGKNFKESKIVMDVGINSLEVMIDAFKYGKFTSISEKEIFKMEYWPLELSKIKSSSLPLLGNIVVITGGLGTLGYATAKKFLKEGAEVVLLDKNNINNLKKNIEGMFFYRCDVTNQYEIQKILKKISEKLGGIDIVISNAGFAIHKSLQNLNKNILEKSFSINLFAHHFLAQQSAAILKTQSTGGSILFNISKQAINPGIDFASYGLPKATLFFLMKQYALEFSKYGIRFNGINADRIKSGLLTNKLISKRAKSRGLSVNAYLSGNLLNKEVKPQDVANAFFYLSCSLKTTACIITVDGGNIEASLR